MFVAQSAQCLSSTIVAHLLIVRSYACRKLQVNEVVTSCVWLAKIAALDVVPDGQTPHTVSLCVYDELVDLAKPGDRITVTGIFRSVPVRVNPRQRTVKSLFKTYIDVVHIQRADQRRLGVDKSTRAGEAKTPGVAGGLGIGGDMDDEINIGADGYTDGMDATDGRPRVAVLEDKLKELSRRPDLYDYLARSLAPSIWEMDDVKKGILLQLFSGANKTVERGGGGGGPRYRGDINVLLVGDPGTSKSQILGVRSVFVLCNYELIHRIVRSQNRSSGSIHFRQRVICGGFDRICDARPRHEATSP